MKDYKFSFDVLNKFSNSDPYHFIPGHYQSLFERLEHFEKTLNFPAIKRDVGSLLAFLMPMLGAQRVFEMGSGYGHSAFWYFIGAKEGLNLEEVVLTEKRSDLLEVFEALPWPQNWKRRMSYYQGDAFERLEMDQGVFDLFLVDGVKGDYKKFVEKALPRLSDNGLIAIDNSYWRGSFLNANLRESKKSAANIYELHEWIKNHPKIEAIFLPFADGLSLIRKS